MSDRYPGLLNKSRSFGAEPFSDENETETESTREFVDRTAPQPERPSPNSPPTVLINGNKVAALAESITFDEDCDKRRRLARSERDPTEAAKLQAEIELAHMIRAGALDEFRVRQSGMLSVALQDGSIRMRDQYEKVGTVRGVKLPLKVPEFAPNEPATLAVLQEGNAEEAPETDSEISLPFPGEETDEPDVPRNPFRPSA